MVTPVGASALAKRAKSWAVSPRVSGPSGPRAGGSLPSVSANTLSNMRWRVGCDPRGPVALERRPSGGFEPWVTAFVSGCICRGLGIVPVDLVRRGARPDAQGKDSGGFTVAGTGTWVVKAPKECY